MKLIGVNNTKMVKVYKNYLKQNIYILPLSAGIFIFLLMPLIEIFVGSLSPDSYRGVLLSDAFWMAIKNTSKFSVLTYVVLMSGSLWVAIQVFNAEKHALLIFSCLLLPYVLPVSTVVQVWKIVFDIGGVFNSLIAYLGIPPENWLESDNAFYIVILLFIWRNGGLVSLVYYFGLKSIPKEYYEVADIEGANRFQKFRYITLNCLMPFVFFNTLLFIINGFKIYREVYMLSGDYPSQSVYMIQHYLNNLFIALNFSRLASATMLFLSGYSVILYIGYKIVYKRVGDLSI